MSLNITPLFAPLQVRGKRLRNRIVMPPMVVLRGLTTPAGIEWYGRRARGGVALVIIEATGVNHFGHELTVANLKLIVDAIHAGGALAAIQLFPVTFGQRPAIAEVTRDELEQIIADYRTAAEVCLAAGFDGVEPHGAHGFLINQAFSPVQNTRSDEFGGDISNRMRLALRIVEAIRPIRDQGLLLLYRHTPVGQGYGIAESLILAQELVKAGVDILDISPASADAPADRAAPFRRFGVPVIAVNEMDRVERALEALNEGRADLIAVGRGLIADPDWPLKVKEGRFDEIVQRAHCNEKCHGNLRKRIPVECVQWS